MSDTHAAAGSSASPGEIFVDYEYGDLTEVIVGVPFNIFPDVETAKWAAEVLKVLPKQEADLMWSRSGKDSIEIGKYAAMEQENEALLEILAKHGVRVHRPDVLTREQIAANYGKDWAAFAGVSQQYTRDPILVIGNNVIENAMGSLYRRCDILGLRRVFSARLPGSGARWVAMPGVDYSTMIQDGDFDKNGYPVIEGGDVIVLGNKILVGTSLNRSTGSSALGYEWLKSYLEPQGYDVERVPLREDVLHLDCALSVPCPGFVIACPDALPNGMPHYFDGWKRFEVTLDDARHLAANGLPINPKNYIIGTNDAFDGKALARALAAEGINVYTIYFGRHNEDGGSIRCSTHPLQRRVN